MEKDIFIGKDCARFKEEFGSSSLISDYRVMDPEG
jgi:hypothetical protein